MTAALTLVLLTATAGDPGNSVTQAVAKATREALGAETKCIVRSPAELPSDAEASALASQLSADAVVELTWSTPDNLHAHVRLLRASTGRWVDRAIGFERADLQIERGRTVGFAVASMLPERAAEPERTLAPDPANEPESEGPPPARRSRPSEVPQPNALLGLPKTEDRPHPERGAVDAVFAAGFGVGDEASGIGGGVALRLSLGSHVFVRVGGAGRVGEIPAAQATLRSLSAAAGLALQATPFPDRSFSVGARADVLALREDLSRLSANAATARQGRWLPGADLLVETAWFFAEGVGIFAAAGGEAAFGRITIFVQGVRVDTQNPSGP